MYNAEKFDADFDGDDAGLNLNGTFTADEAPQVLTKQTALVAASVTPEKPRRGFQGNQYSNKDRYELAVDYLAENPGEIIDAFYTSYNHKHNCLFFGIPQPLMDPCIQVMAVGLNDGKNKVLAKNLQKMYKEGKLLSQHNISKLKSVRKRRKALQVYANIQRAADICFRPL